MFCNLITRWQLIYNLFEFLTQYSGLKVRLNYHIMTPPTQNQSLLSGSSLPGLGTSQAGNRKTNPPNTQKLSTFSNQPQISKPSNSTNTNEDLQMFSTDILSHHQQIQNMEDPMDFVLNDEDILNIPNDTPLTQQSSSLFSTNKQHSTSLHSHSNHSIFKPTYQEIKMEEHNINILNGFNDDFISAEFMNDQVNYPPSPRSNPDECNNVDPFANKYNNSIPKHEPIDLDMFLTSAASPDTLVPTASIPDSANPSLLANDIALPTGYDIGTDSDIFNPPAESHPYSIYSSQDVSAHSSPDSEHKSSSASIKSRVSFSSSTSLSSSESVPARKNKVKVRNMSSDIAPPSYMPDFSPSDWDDLSDLKYQMAISEIPTKSRVETQIKIAIDFYPPPPESIVHLPTDTISKPKLQLRDPFVPIPTALSMDTVVVCITDESRYVNMCRCCLNRERKRAFRKKVRLPSEEAHWSLDQEKRAIVFNCKEIVDFGSLVDIEVDGEQVKAKRLELPIRMACYCRHHNEKIGFKALFVIKDHTGAVVSRGSTSPIMITDDHKAAPTKANAGVKRQNHEIEMVEDTQLASASATPSPKTVDTDYSIPPRKKSLVSKSSFGVLPTTSSDSYHSRRSFAKKSAPSPSNIPSNGSSPGYQFNSKSPLSPSQHYTYSPPASLDLSALGVNGNIITRPHSTQLSPMDSHAITASHTQMMQSLRSNGSTASPSSLMTNSVMAPFSSPQTEDLLMPLPDIQKVVPQTGPVRGGIDVSLFGVHFIDGLIPKFGDNNAVSTIYWSPKSLVTQLPPAKRAGPVIVSFEGISTHGAQIFSYFDDTDRQLIELALRVVGVKMNGKLEDVRDIARRIVGTGTGFDSDINSFTGTSQNTQNHSTGPASDGYSSRIPKENLEPLLLSLIELINSSQTDFAPNWQLRNNEGQGLLHLASILGFETFCCALVSNGAHVDIQDCNGYTPLHFAALNGHDNIVSQLLEHNSDPSICTYSGQTYKDLLEQQSVSEYPSTQDMFAFNTVEAAGESSEDESEDDSFDNGRELDYPVSTVEFAFNDEDSDESEYDDSDDLWIPGSERWNEDFESDSVIEDTQPIHGSSHQDDSSIQQEAKDDTLTEAPPANFAHKIGSLFPFFSRSQITPEGTQKNLAAGQFKNAVVNGSTTEVLRRPWLSYMAGDNDSENMISYKNPFATGSAMLAYLFDRHHIAGSASRGSDAVKDALSREISSDDDIHNFAPPDYYDLFPEGNERGANFSSAIIEEEKQTEQQKVQEALTTSAAEVKAPDVEAELEHSTLVLEQIAEKTKTAIDSGEGCMITDVFKTGPSAEEEVEIWRNNRKKLQNDRMFLFFWLPVFVFILVWMCYNAISFMDRFDAASEGGEGGVLLRAHRAIRGVAASVFGVEKYQQYQQRAMKAIQAIDRVTAAAVTGVANVATGNVAPEGFAEPIAV